MYIYMNRRIYWKKFIGKINFQIIRNCHMRHSKSDKDDLLISIHGFLIWTNQSMNSEFYNAQGQSMMVFFR